MCGLRGQIFRQCVQIISSHTDVWVLIFGHNDGTICKQGVRRELCGVALKQLPERTVKKHARKYKQDPAQIGWTDRVYGRADRRKIQTGPCRCVNRRKARDMRDTFIMLPRDIRLWKWYSNGNTFRVFLHLILTANFTDCGFEGFVIHWGQVATSYDSLSRDTGLSYQEVRTAIKHLKSTGDITVKNTSKFSIITIKDFGRFQRQTGTSTGNQQAVNRQSTGLQQQYNNGIKEEYNNSSETDIWAASRALIQRGK